MPHRRPPRLRTFDYRGFHAYSVTMCTAHRARLFMDDEVVRAVRMAVLRTCAERQFAVLAYVFMPDHVHLLVQGEHERAAFTPFMKLLRQRTAIAFCRTHQGHLWQDGYYERVIRSTDNLAAVAAYIVANPVRAGLTSSVEEYPYSFMRAGDGTRGSDGRPARN